MKIIYSKDLAQFYWLWYVAREPRPDISVGLSVSCDILVGTLRGTRVCGSLSLINLDELPKAVKHVARVNELRHVRRVVDTLGAGMREVALRALLMQVGSEYRECSDIPLLQSAAPRMLLAAISAETTTMQIPLLRAETEFGVELGVYGNFAVAERIDRWG